MLCVTSLTHLILSKHRSHYKQYNTIMVQETEKITKKNSLFTWVFSLWLAHLLSNKSSCLSRSFITWQPRKLKQCSQSRKENWLVHLSSRRFWVVRSSRDSLINLTYAVWAGKRLNNNNQLSSLLPLLPHSVLWKRTILTEIHTFINCKK